jgi:hypothetical protein
MKFSLIGLGKMGVLAGLACLLEGCIDLPIQQGQDSSPTATNLNKPLLAYNHIYEPATIKTVRMYAGEASANPKQYFNPPVVALGQNQPIMLEFDQLGHQPKYYQAKIVHCNQDWTPSKLLDMEFINEINEFQVQRYEVSFRTKVNYLHYKFTVPKVKISGNYLVVVSQNNNQEDRVLVHRFMVYENKLNITPEVRVPLQADARERKQQIDLRISYTDYNVINATEEFKITIRQNYRWNNIRHNLKPTAVREFDHIAEYAPMNGENYFVGLNEHRRFDARSTRFLGYRISGLNLKDSLSLEIEPDVSRGNMSYFRFPDFNGNFIVSRQDAQLPHIEAEYVWVQFQLRTPKIESPVYVIGAFNNWQTNEENLLQYDDKIKAYQTQIYLKQGEYNYMYVVKQGDDLEGAQFEGSFQNTENDYDVWVYHRPLGSRSDKIIGYKRFNTSQSH